MRFCSTNNGWYDGLFCKVRIENNEIMYERNITTYNAESGKFLFYTVWAFRRKVKSSCFTPFGLSEIPFQSS